MNSQKKAEQFELLYSAYIAKLHRFDELRALGRYGYQIRMPRIALQRAMDDLRRFGKEHNVEVESLFH